VNLVVLISHINYLIDTGEAHSHRATTSGSDTGNTSIVANRGKLEFPVVPIGNPHS